ncbi:GspH/FimT family pseudopilin [soil metagenome]
MPISAAGNSRPDSDGFAPGRRGVEQGFTPVRRYAEHGFTLVEMMVVIVLLGLASAAVVWALPDPRGRLAVEAERFAGRARAAHDLAIAGARPVSLWVTATGYGFDERRGGAWVAIGDKPLRVTQWSEGTRAQLGGGRERVIFDPTGLVDHGLAVRLERGTATSAVTIGGDGAVKLGE